MALRSPNLRFALLFGLYLTIAGLLYPQLRGPMYFAIDGLERATAWIQYAVLSLFSSQVELQGKVVIFGSFPAKIVEECTGAYEMVIFAAAVLAFPASWRQRALGMGLGLPMLYAFNLLRIAVLMVVGRYWPDQLKFMHVYFWQGTLVAMILSTWLVWIYLVVRDDASEAAPAADLRA